MNVSNIVEAQSTRGKTVMYNHIVNDIATGVIYRRNGIWVYVNLKSLTVTDKHQHRNDLFDIIHIKSTKDFIIKQEITNESQ